MNPVIEALSNRVSIHKLGLPAPSETEIKGLFQSCVYVPDHKQLRPWRFLHIRGEGLKELGLLFAESYKRKNPDTPPEELESKQAKALRAPLIIIGICQYQAHDKVPEFEQQISTGCVLHNLGLGLRSMGYGSIWRTGDFACDPFINQKLGLKDNETIMGYLYIGTPEGREKNQRPIDIDDYLQDWP